ncbi:hypothetical protein L0U85_19250 [Glycomyces sp. L485]|uniref:hypothetical protein n=1 Tax=Glycomyces sp. L485 TaxID=2909235 RepID=UPI001F4BA32C|nr:hypothetical protein [Glycomyces sp. L485]MCH7232973.1 hypothetical protein [Glycomyces sp. L485]
MSEFSIEPEEVRGAAETMFEVSDEIYEKMRTVGDAAAALEGSADTVEFTGIAEVLQASEIWECDYIATHRADIEDLAEFLTVHAETSIENDKYVASMFDRYATSDDFPFDPDYRTAPPAERPAPDPADQMPRGGESLAV